MWATRRAITEPWFPQTASWSTVLVTTIRRISARPSGSLLLTPTALARPSHGAPLPDGRLASAWVWLSVHGVVRGGARSDTGDGAGVLRPGDGADGVAQPRPTSTAVGATPPTPELARHGRIPGPGMLVQAHADPITTR